MVTSDMRKHLREVILRFERWGSVPLGSVGRLRTMFDTVFAVAIGSVCACALTLGPVPVNTVSPPSSLTAGAFELGDHAAAAPSDLEQPTRPDAPSSDAPAAEFPAPDQPRATAQVPPPGPVVAPPQAHAPGAHPPGSNEQAKPHTDVPAEARRAAPSKKLTPPHPKFAEDPGEGAVSIINELRTANGLKALLTEQQCAAPTLQAIVQLTPGLTLPPKQAQAGLLPDPASASVETVAGRTVVNLFSCS
jgi:hypothetical protein